MSILDTFYILFSTDAKEAEKEMADAKAQAEGLGDAMAKVGDGAEDAAKSAAKVADALDKAGAPDTAGVAKLDDALRDAATSAGKVDDAMGSVAAPDTSGVKRLDDALDDAAKTATDVGEALDQAGVAAGSAEAALQRQVPIREQILSDALDVVEAERNLTQYLLGNEDIHEHTLDLLGGQEGLQKRIAAETDQVAREMVKAERAADKLENELDQANDEARRLNQSFMGMARNLLAPVAAVVSLGALIGGVKGHLDAVTQLIERASRARIDVSSYDAWRRAIRAAGGDAERAEGQFEAFADKVTEAFGDADSEAGKALASMGVSAKDASGNIKSTDVALLDLADAMSKVSRQTAVDSLRRLGIVDPTMVDMILQGREGLEALLETQRKSGAITTQQANTYKAFRTAINALSDAFRSQVDAVLGLALPAFTRFIDWVKTGLDWMSKNRKVVEGFGIALAVALGVAAAVALGVYAPAMWAAAVATLAATWPILAIIAAVVALAAAFALAYEDVSNFLSGQPSLLGDLAKRYGWVRDAIEAVRRSISWLRENGGRAWDAFQRGLEIVMPIVRKLAGEYLVRLGQSFRALVGIIRGVWSVAGPILGFIGDLVWTIAVVAFRTSAAIARVMGAAFRAILDVARPTLDQVGGAVRILQGVFSSVAGAVQAVWSRFFGWFAEKLGWAVAAARGVLGVVRGASQVIDTITPGGGPRQPPAAPGAAGTRSQVQTAQRSLVRADRSPTNAVTQTAVAARRAPDRRTELRVDNLNVHTQATDAQGMARGATSALRSELRRAGQDNDDGVER